MQTTLNYYIIMLQISETLKSIMNLSKAIFVLKLLIAVSVANGQSSCPPMLPIDFPLLRNASKTSMKGHQSRTFVNGTDKADGRIVGGQLSTGVLHDYVVQLYWRGSFACTATLINKRYVLSAAHCAPPTVSDTIIWFYTPELEDWWTPREVRRLIIHPKYDAWSTTIENDIMFLVLKEDAPDTARYVSVNVLRDIPEPNAMTRAAGFGVTKEGGSTDMRLRQVDVPARSKSSCEKLESTYVHKEHICASYVCGGCDACQGDSGGPLFQFDTEGYVYQIGIVSYGVGCARPRYPGVYTRLSTHEDWIHANTGEYGYNINGIVPQMTVSPDSCPQEL